MDENQSILYHNAYSICSLMVRYTLALRGKPKDEHSNLSVREVSVDLYKGEQLTEDFLCGINKYGQIPVLDVKEGTPIHDSLEITRFIAKRYPNLIPESHQEEITALLNDLHKLNYFSLSFKKSGGARVAADLAAAVENLLQDPNLSDRYRSALEFKRDVVKSSKVTGMEPEAIKEMEDRAGVVLDRLSDTLPEKPQGSRDGLWMFGLPEPSALDVHTIVFVERMRDVGRLDLVPEKLNAWSQRATEQKAWRSLTNGRRTMATPPQV